MFPLQERRPRTPCAQSTARERGLSSPGDSIDKGVPGRGGSRGEETVAGEGRALFSFDPGCGRGGRYNNPVPTRKQNREVLPLAARPRLAENSRQGVPTSTQTLYWGFEFAISSTYIGLQFRCSETVSGPVVAPNSGAACSVFSSKSQCMLSKLKTLWDKNKNCVANVGWPVLSADLNPFSLGVGTAATAASDASQASLQAAATWSVSRGLTVPLRSGIVRAGVGASEVLGRASGILTGISVIYAEADAIVAEHNGCTF